MVLAATGIYIFVRGSAPRLDGTVKLAGLGARAEVARDALGVPTISARSRVDLARVVGFLHGQDRFFQMDLMRRLAAGELAALVGRSAIRVDEKHRLFRLRAVARQVLARCTASQRALLKAYAGGVNAGLHALTTRPFQYGILMQTPKPWRPEDSVLVIFAMYFKLQDAYDRRESDLALMRDVLPASLFRFLSAAGTRWDAPLAGPALATPPVPGADQVNLRTRSASDFPPPARRSEQASGVPGSNSFAVSGGHSADGHAILANDIHLGLGVPNIWYRAQFNYPDPDQPQHKIKVTGITLPGVPFMVVGSNGHVAWGFTNSYGDWVDLVRLHVDVHRPDKYLTAYGWRAFVHHKETIRVAGGKPVTEDVKDTIWGPVVKPDHNGVPRAVHWIADDPAGTNLELDRMAQARTIKEAMAVANRAGIPEQNFLVVDSNGNIGWTIAGRIPVRTGYDPEFPAYWNKAGTGWTGWLAPGSYPRIVDPPGGRLWTANARVVNGAMLSQIGDGGYALGARARQIRDDLNAAGILTPAAMLKIQLDDRAVFLGRWRALILRLLNAARVNGHPRRAQFVHYVRDWGGKAAVDSVGYRLVRDFRSRVEQVVFEALTAPCRKIAPGFDYTVLTQREGALWVLVTRQPPNLLAPKYASWNDLLLAAADHVIGKLWRPGSGLATRTWGQRNTVRIRGAMSRALPVLSRWLDMKPVELPGDRNMPRVQAVHFGASARMVMEPGREHRGIFEMPAGESAYPLSPYYRNSEPAWEQGLAASFLPGKTQHQLTFQPTP